jgi:2-polyprenyl-6-methoxyphenol hydroxylase-like FAD-dependent oxidoreductase
MRACEPTAKALAGARIAQKISGIVKFDGYLRQASGPGWVLVGDAGHFKDPSAGRGIGDAFLQVEALVPAIVASLDGTGPGGADETLRRWGTWRDRRFEGHYWLATTLGEAGPLPGAVPEALRRLEERGQLDRFFDLFSHRSRYYDVFPLREMGLATARRLVAGTQPRGPLLKEALGLLAREPRRRWINRHPALASSDLTAPPAARTPRTARPDRRETADAAHNG